MSNRFPRRPAGSPIVPVLSVQDVDRAADFYARAFGLDWQSTGNGNGSRSRMAEVRWGNGRLLLRNATDAARPLQDDSPSATNGMELYLFTGNVDRSLNRLLESGAQMIPTASDPDWGDRLFKVLDPAGVVWCVVEASMHRQSSRKEKWQWTNTPPPIPRPGPIPDR